MKKKLESLINLFKENESYYMSSSYNEQECRNEFISPLLECFGWDVNNSNRNAPQFREVLVERYVENMKKPDYTLTFHGFTKFFVEAKKPSVDLNTLNLPAIQARKYGWNAKHKIVVLTNFKNLYIYDTTTLPRENDSNRNSLFKKYEYTEYIEKYDEIIKYIGRNTVYNGDFDVLMTNLFLANERDTLLVDEFFLKDINCWRLELGNYLYNSSDERYKNLTFLNDVIQNFINRIVFLRICEDRNIDTYTTLYKTISEITKLKDKLKELFVQSDRMYNSGLFEGNDIILDLDNEIIMRIINSLYYPTSPYLFNIIEPNLLGRIYEVFLTEKISMGENNTIVLEKKKECKNKSVVSTPVEIVKSIIFNTVKNKVYQKSFNEILDMSFIDIACGSGVFLEEAFDLIVNESIEYFKNTDISKLEFKSNGEYKLPFKYKKMLMERCIYGIDIDAQATEVCKFSLLIKLLEDECSISLRPMKSILPNLDSNIKCGNSLVSYNDVNLLDIDKLIEINPFNWSDINSGLKFDCVIGNPPYVKTEDMHQLLLKEEFDIYLSKYKTSYKQFDKYFTFIEK